jgi:conjugal transfer pilus assembly protein TraB
MATFGEQFKKKWDNTPPAARAVTAIVVVLGTLMIGASLMMGPAKSQPQKRMVAASETNLLLPKSKDKTVEKVAAESASNGQEIDKVKAELAKEKADNQAMLQRLEASEKARTTSSVDAEVVQELIALKKRLDEVEKNKSAGPGPKLSDPVPAGAAGLANPVLDGTPAAAGDAPKSDDGPKLRVIGGDKPAVIKESKKAAKVYAYMPAGSMVEAVLMNGMDAPTSAVSQKNPVPAVMRVKSDAILPNHFTHDIKECFVLVSGFGVMSSERAQLRTETYSCIRENGQVLEGKLDGYVVGEDGRVGARGRLVSKQGSLIAKSLAAGVLSGIGQAVTPMNVPQLNLNPSSMVQTQTTDVGTIAQTGVARGLSDASKAAAHFYLEIAREMTPVVEIDAGRKLTIVLIKGVEFK